MCQPVVRVISLRGIQIENIHLSTERGVTCTTQRSRTGHHTARHTNVTSRNEHFFTRSSSDTTRSSGMLWARSCTTGICRLPEMRSPRTRIHASAMHALHTTNTWSPSVVNGEDSAPVAAQDAWRRVRPCWRMKFYLSNPCANGY